MILKMYIADQLCYEYIFEPHFRWYESMISLTLLTPCIFSFVNLYMYIVYHGLCFTISWQKSHIFFLYGPSIKKPSTWLWSVSPCWDTNQKGCEVCAEPHKPLLVHKCSQLVYLYLCATIFLYKAPAHIHPHKGHPLIL